MAADRAAIVALMADDMLGRAREDTSLPLDPGYVAAFAAIAADPNQMLLVTGSEGAPEGVLQLTFIPGIGRRGAWRAQIEGVRVAGALRGQGMGRRMIRAAVEIARARGCAYVQLTSHKDRTRAHAFYDALGFQRTQEAFVMFL